MQTNYTLESLEEIAGGDQEFMTTVASTFLQEIPPDLAALEAAIENNNKELAYQFTHKMKPNIEMFGIDILKDITAIESWTKSNKSKTTISSNVETISKRLHQVFEELKADFPS